MSINCIRTAKAPLQSFASSVRAISKPRDSSNCLVSVFGSKSSPSFVTLRIVSSMAYEKELDAAKKAASLAARLCQVRVFFFLRFFYPTFSGSIMTEIRKFDSLGNPFCNLPHFVNILCIASVIGNRF